MSNLVMNHVFQKSKSTGSKRLMLLSIADICDDNGDCYPGTDRLAEKCNCSVRYAQMLIKNLELSGELEVYENYGTKTPTGYTNLYHIPMPGINKPLGSPRIAFEKVEPKKRQPKEPKKRTDEPPSVKRKRANHRSPKNNAEIGQGVNGDSPLGVNGDSPRHAEGVNGDSPNPKLLPQDSPQVKRNLRLPAYWSKFNVWVFNRHSAKTPKVAKCRIISVPVEVPQPVVEVVNPSTGVYDCTSQDINALIGAWWDWIPKKPTKRGKIEDPKRHFANPANREYAENLWKRGARPADVIQCMIHLKQTSRADKEMTFCYFAAILEDWIPQDRLENGWTVDCPRRTPLKPGVKIEMGEISNRQRRWIAFMTNPNLIVDVPPRFLSAQVLSDEDDESLPDVDEIDWSPVELDVPLDKLNDWIPLYD